MANKNKNLHSAKVSKKDEFYTQLSDIEKELKHYKQHFKDKVVLCNCDDPRVSNFFHYFSYNFEQLGLKKLITTCYKNQQRDLFSQHDSERAIYLEYTGDKNGNNVPDPEEIGIKHLKGDGDFRSEECIELLKQADIVVTNPPFSLFREFVAQLVKFDKKFLIIGNVNAVTYKETFKLIKENKLWLGASIHSGDREFGVPDDYPLETQIAALMMDEDVTKKSGIYLYVLTGEEKYLNIRAFSENQKREAYERQKGICVKCGEHFELNEMEADHITPWHEGGKTSAENCQMLCKDDNRRKSGK